MGHMTSLLVSRYIALQKGMEKADATNMNHLLPHDFYVSLSSCALGLLTYLEGGPGYV